MEAPLPPPGEKLLTNFVCSRFGTHVSGAPSVQRSLRINNTSPYGELMDVWFRGIRAPWNAWRAQHAGQLRVAREFITPSSRLITTVRTLFASQNLTFNRVIFAEFSSYISS